MKADRPTRADLAQALLKFARHRPECYGLRNFERECDCGWYALRQQCQEIVKDAVRNKDGSHG